MSLQRLQGLSVLEVGSGAGRFTELLAAHCETLMSADMSAAVDANLANCAERFSYTLLQADVEQLPLRKRSFDVVVCFGVIQHAPSRETTIAQLASELRLGGKLVIEHDERVGSGLGKLASYLNMAVLLRSICKRMEAERASRATIAVHRVCDPVRRLTSRAPRLDRHVQRFLPSGSVYVTHPELDLERAREWGELNAHDNLTDFYEHLRSEDEIRSCLTDLGLRDVVTVRGGNAIEARGTYGPG